MSGRKQNPDHFIIITSSYLTKHTHEWLQLIKKSTSFKIHVLEGKELKQLLLSQTTILLKYFQEETAKLIEQLLKQWIFHDVLPGPKAVYNLVNKVDPSKLNGPSLAFLLFICLELSEEIEKYCDEEQVLKWNRSFLLSHFEKCVSVSHDYPIFSTREMKTRDLLINNYGYSKRSFRKKTKLRYIYLKN